MSLVNLNTYRSNPDVNIVAEIIPDLRSDYHDFSTDKQYATNHQLYKQNYKTGIGSIQPGCLDVVEYANISSQGNPRLPETTFANTIRTTQVVDVLPNDDVRFYAGDMVHINYEFKANVGSDFLATITPCNYGICRPCVLSSSNPAAFPPGGNGRYATEYAMTDKLNENKNVRIIPNPATNAFVLSFRNNVMLSSEEEQEITIVTIDGKKVKEFKPQKTYDIHDLKSGTYLLHITTNEKKYYIRLVKW